MHTGPRRTVRFALVAVALLAVAGCTGDDGGDGRAEEQARRATWTVVANELCESEMPVPLPAGAEVGDLATGDEAVATSHVAAGEQARELVDRWRDLAPADGEPARLLDALAAQVDQLESAQDDPVDRSLAAARLRLVADEIAERLGLESCRGVLGVWSGDGPAPTAPLVPEVICLTVDGQLPVDDIGAAIAGGEPALCEEPHDLATYARFAALPVAGEGFPGEVALAQQATAQCHRTFTEAFGSSPLAGPSIHTAMIPDAQHWSAGERDIVCVRLDPGGEQLPGSD